MAKIQTLFGSLEDLEKQKKEAEEREGSFFGRMRNAVARTRENLGERIDDLVSVNKEIDRYTLDELEAILINADLGSEVTQQVLASLRLRADRKQIENFDEIKIARAAYSPADLEKLNINLVGGDPYGGSSAIDQAFLWRPFKTSRNHQTGIKNLYHIGASTHPGAGLGGGSGFLLAGRL